MLYVLYAFYAIYLKSYIFYAHFMLILWTNDEIYLKYEGRSIQGYF